MSGLEITIRLAVVAVLAGYLYTKHRQRVLGWSEGVDPAKWTGRAIDVAKLKPRVEELRRDYLSGRPPAKGLCFHQSLLNLARRVVVQLAYFHDREPEAHEHTHSP
jgi:hypothetical protein